jgi:hypothetical protein
MENFRALGYNIIYCKGSSVHTVHKLHLLLNTFLRVVSATLCKGTDGTWVRVILALVGIWILWSAAVEA